MGLFSKSMVFDVSFLIWRHAQNSSWHCKKDKIFLSSAKFGLPEVIWIMYSPLGLLYLPQDHLHSCVEKNRFSGPYCED